MWRKNKYGNKKTKVLTKFGLVDFSSGLEADVYHLLDLRERSKDIVIEKVQDTLYLSEARFRYTPDFRCKDLVTGEVFWVEAKGYDQDPTWRRNLRLWKICGPGKLEIWKGTPPKLAKTVFPKGGVCKTCGRDFKEETA